MARNGRREKPLNDVEAMTFDGVPRAAAPSFQPEPARPRRRTRRRRSCCEARSRRVGRDRRGWSLLADRVPHRRGLDKGAKSSKRRGVALFRAQHALDRPRGAGGELVRELVIPHPPRSSIDVFVRRQRRGELSGVARDDVERSRRKVCRRPSSHRAESTGRAPFARDHHDRITDGKGREDRARTLLRKVLFCEHAHHATGHRNREVKERSGDRVRRAQHLGDLCRSSRVPHDPVDGP